MFFSSSGFELSNIERLDWQLPSSTISHSVSYLNAQFPLGYSYGQLIDFIDQRYDEYKMTHLSPEKYHLLFISFGVHAIEISNIAFDVFMETRDTYHAWHYAVSSFLSDVVLLPKELANIISNRVMES